MGRFKIKVSGTRFIQGHIVIVETKVSPGLCKRQKFSLSEDQGLDRSQKRPVMKVKTLVSILVC